MTDDVAHATYWLIQYSPDYFRHEPRNIGVFLHDGRSARCMMLGEKKGGFDPRYFCHAFSIDEKTGWIYREWNHWFRTLARNGMVIDIESIHTELERLRMRGDQFSVTEPSLVEMTTYAVRNSILEKLFRENVVVPRLPEFSPIERDFDEVLRVSELAYLPTFHRDVEVELGNGKDNAFVNFDAVLEEPEPLGIKVIQFQRVRENTLISQTNDALYSFGTSLSQGFLVPERCIVLHDKPPASRARHLDRLAGHARLLPLWEKQTPRELYRIALRQ
jgi:hypothetical protein